MPEDIKKCLLAVAANEKLSLTEGGASILARLADGSMRDGLSLLESCVSAADGAEINEDIVSRQLGIAGDDTVVRLFGAMEKRSTADCLKLLDDYYNSSKSMAVLIERMISAVRDILVFSQPSVTSEPASPLSPAQIKELSGAFTPPELLYIADVLEETQTKLVRYPFNKRLLMELMLVRLCDSRLSSSEAALLARVSALEARQTTVFQPRPETPAVRIEDTPPQEAPERISVKVKRKPFEGFAELVERLKSNITLSSLIADSKVMTDGTTIYIITSPFSIAVMEENESIAAIKEALSALGSGEYNIKFENPSSKNDDEGLIDEI